MKYLIKRAVRGRYYYYLRYELRRRSPSRPVVITRHLGSAPPVDIRPQLEALFKEVGIKAASLTDAKGVTPFRPDSILKIESARFRYRCLSHELFESDRVRFQRLFTILFILNSNRAEGSKVEKREIEDAMKRRAAPRSQVDLEILNSINALGYAFSGKMKWSSRGARKVHSMLFDDLQPRMAGRFRRVGVVVGEGADPATSTTTPWREISGEMRKLFTWLAKARRDEVYPPWLAVEFHWRFERIHPFEDGNGRTGRILMNALLQHMGYMPVIFNMNRAKAYSGAIARAVRGHVEPLASFFGEQTEWTAEAVRKYCEVIIDEEWKRHLMDWSRAGRMGIVYD